MTDVFLRYNEMLCSAGKEAFCFEFPKMLVLHFNEYRFTSI